MADQQRKIADASREASDRDAKAETARREDRAEATRREEKAEAARKEDRAEAARKENRDGAARKDDRDEEERIREDRAEAERQDRLDRLDRRSLATLEPTIRRLQIRLCKGISPEKSWEAFRDEAGSLLLSRAYRMFVDGVQLGGPPEQVGALAAEYATDSALMRAGRAVSAAPFAFLAYPSISPWPG